jgi:hypothetical protein
VEKRRLAETARASVTTPAALPATTDIAAAAFPSLVVTIDGGAAPTSISFVATDFADPANATSVEIVNAINARTENLDASLSGTGALVLTSTGNVATLSGGFTSLAVAINATLGFPAALTGDGTPAALGAGGTTLHRVDGLEVGDAIQLTDGATTEVVKLLTVNPLTRAVTWAPPLAAPAAYNRLLLRIRNLEFDVQIFLGGPDTEQLVETWPGLSMEADLGNYAVARINDPLVGSKFVRAVDEASATATGADRPVDLAAPAQFLTGHPHRVLRVRFVRGAVGHV